MKSYGLEVLFLSEEDVVAAGLDMKMIMPILEDVIEARGRGTEIRTAGLVLNLGPEQKPSWNRLLGYGRYLGGKFDVLCSYSLATFPDNSREHGIPRSISLLVLHDPLTGAPLAIISNVLISQMNVGANTGMAAKFLARKDSEVVTIIGASVQGKTNMLALNAVLENIKEVRAYDIRRDAAKKYAKQIGEKTGLNVVVADSPRKAVEGADVIVTVTTADEPIVKNYWVKKGSFFSHVGSYQEEEYEVIKNSDKIVVHDWENSKAHGLNTLARMHKEGLIKDQDIYAELSEIIAGKKPGRETDQERIYFYQQQNYTIPVIARAICRRAIESGIGTKLKLWTEDPWKLLFKP